MLRRLIRRLQCLFRGHISMCGIRVDRATMTERHIHQCLWCGRVTMDETGPLQDDVRTLLADIGMPVEEQSAYLH